MFHVKRGKSMGASDEDEGKAMRRAESSEVFGLAVGESPAWKQVHHCPALPTMQLD